MSENNTEQLDRMESKIDELIADHQFMMKKHSRFHGLVYGLAGGSALSWLIGYLWLF